ncbi:MAG: rod shape-determining protein RodA [Pseudomonadota bacterium]
MTWAGELRSGPSRARRFGRQTNFDKLQRMPWGFVALIVGLALFGTAMLYSATATNPANADLPMKHFVRFAASFILMMGLAFVPLSFWARAAYPAYALAFVLLVAVDFVGASGGGAERWLEIGPLRMQPSEVMKLALTLALATYYHTRLKDATGGFWIHVPAILLILAPAALVMRQPDLGTALTIIASGMVIVYFAGLLWRVILLGLVGGLVGAPFAYFFVLKDYQRARVETLWNPSADPLGAGYQSEQAKIAIGSGGWDGKGFTQGTQSQLDFIPAQHTDFIFTVMAEEFGFLGASGLLFVWGAVIVWGFVIAMRSHNLFGRFAAIGAVATIAFYVAFNIGMVAGILPVVGIPLPLISYGGSAMIAVMAAFGLVLSVHIHRESKLGL